MAANKASWRVMRMRIWLASLVLAVGISPVAAGFHSPESLVRNVYAYYGDRSSDLSSGLPHDADTVRQFFDPSPSYS
jgi:hypothetical protein